MPVRRPSSPSSRRPAAHPWGPARPIPGPPPFKIAGAAGSPPPILASSSWQVTRSQRRRQPRHPVIWARRWWGAAGPYSTAGPGPTTTASAEPSLASARTAAADSPQLDVAASYGSRRPAGYRRGFKFRLGRVSQSSLAGSSAGVARPRVLRPRPRAPRPQV